MRASVPSCPALRDSPFASGSKPQLRLDVPSLGPHERAGLPTLSIVRAFTGEPTTMPSAEFRAAMTALAGTLGPGLSHATRTSGGKTGRLHRTAAESTTLALGKSWIRRLPAGCIASCRSLHAPSIPRHRLVPRIRGPFRGARRGETPLSGVCVTLIRVPPLRAPTAPGGARAVGMRRQHRRRTADTRRRLRPMSEAASAAIYSTRGTGPRHPSNREAR